MLDFHEHLAADGDVTSLLYLSTIARRGSKVSEVDMGTAKKYLRKAAELRNPSASGQLGCILVSELIQKKSVSLEEAKDIHGLLKYSASKGDLHGIVGMAYCSLLGIGTRKNITYAIESLSKASSKSIIHRLLCCDNCYMTTR